MRGVSSREVRPMEGTKGLQVIPDLFEDEVRDVQLAPGAMVLGGFARRFEGPLVTACNEWRSSRPFGT